MLGKSSFIEQKKQAGGRERLSVNPAEKRLRKGESSHGKSGNVQDFSAISADWAPAGRKLQLTQNILDATWQF